MSHIGCSLSIFGRAMYPWHTTSHTGTCSDPIWSCIIPLS